MENIIAPYDDYAETLETPEVLILLILIKCILLRLIIIMLYLAALESCSV